MAVLTRDGRLGDERQLSKGVMVGVDKAFGGWGKEAILMVFRTDFSGIKPLAFPREEAERTVGTAGVEAVCCRVGRAECRRGVEGERSLVGFNVEDNSPGFLVMTGRLLLGLLDGKGGRAVFGGSIGGRDKTGSAVAPVVDMVVTADRISIPANMNPARRSPNEPMSFVDDRFGYLPHEFF